MRGVRRITATVVAGLALGGCGAGAPASEPAPRPGQTRFEDRLRGLTVTFPSDWHRARRTLTPTLIDPREVLTLATHPLRRGPAGNCGKLPVQAVRDMGRDDVLVTIQERRTPHGFPPRPRPLRLAPRELGDAGACTRRTDVLSSWNHFREHGRGFYVEVVSGAAAPPARLRQAEAVVASLRVDPIRERNGVRVLPPRGWRLHDARLTGLHGELLAVASYRIPHRRVDHDCSPRAALEAMPPDGGLLYLFEYRDLNATQMRRFPRHRPALRLRERERRSYECAGESWLVMWQENGRALQAHAYLGPRAGARRRAELRAAFRSLVVERAQE